ncbi:MAG: hypothetical protein QM771_15080 [Nitrospira sp.]
MQRKIYGSLVLLMLVSSCSTGGQKVSTSRNDLGTRIERASRFLTRTVINATNDLLPLVRETTGEIMGEIKTDLPKVADELGRQMRHVTSIGKSPATER